MASELNPAATEHLPFFITPPGEPDILFNVMVVVVLIAIVMIGVFYFRLHALPEHMAHRSTKVQYEIVAVLGLISLFTHNHMYWIIGLLLAMVQLPDFTTPVTSIADSLAKMAGTKTLPASASEPTSPAGAMTPTLDVAAE